MPAIIKFLTLTAYMPDGQVVEYDGDRIVAAGLDPESGAPYFAVTEPREGGEPDEQPLIRTYRAIPFSTLEDHSSKLQAPERKGGKIIG